MGFSGNSSSSDLGLADPWLLHEAVDHPHLRKRDLFMRGHRIFFRRRFRG
jgi:hypothetical protein